MFLVKIFQTFSILYIAHFFLLSLFLAGIPFLLGCSVLSSYIFRLLRHRSESHALLLSFPSYVNRYLARWGSVIVACRSRNFIVQILKVCLKFASLFFLSVSVVNLSNWKISLPSEQKNSISTFSFWVSLKIGYSKDASDLIL